MKVGSDMLLRFSVANFLSIRDQVEFSMIATDSKQKPLNHVMRCGKYNVLKEYSRYYLCECVQNGRSLYKECFLKIDVDGVKEISLEKESNPRVGWHM